MSNVPAIIGAVEQCLWLVHYGLIREEFRNVLRDKYPGCQTIEPIQLSYELCLFDSPKNK